MSKAVVFVAVCPLMTRNSIEDATKAYCSDEKPYKCLPFASCYGYTQFCSNQSDAVESCFPSGNTDLLNWCIHAALNNSLWLHPSCQYACIHKFGSLLKAATNDNNEAFKDIVIIVLGILLLFSVFINIVFCVFARSKKFIQRRRADKDVVNPGEQIPLSPDSITVRAAQEPSAAVGGDNRVNDRNIHQTAIQGFNGPDNLQFDEPLRTSTENAKDAQTRNHTSPSSPSASSSTAAARDDSGNASEISTPLDFTNREQETVTFLASPTIPELEGVHSVATSASLYNSTGEYV